jgi:hypothetical protein
VSYRHSLLDQLLACSEARQTVAPSKSAADLREEFEACKASLPDSARAFIEGKLKAAEVGPEELPLRGPDAPVSTLRDLRERPRPSTPP